MQQSSIVPTTVSDPPVPNRGVPNRQGFASIPVAAAFLDLSKPMLYKLVANGQIPSRRYGRSVRVPWSWLHDQAACDQ